MADKVETAGVPPIRQAGFVLLAICFVLTVVVALMHTPLLGTAIVMLAVVAGALITSGS